MSNQLYYRPESAKLIDGKQNQEEEKPKSNRELLPNFTFPEEDKIESRDKNSNGTFTMEQVLNDNANLRSELYQLKLANDTMRRHIENEDDYTRIISDATIFDGLSRAELTSNYARLRQKYNSQVSNLNEYKKRVSSLQEALIKQNKIEKKYLDLESMQNSERKMLDKLRKENDKYKKISLICKQQEHIIRKMEILLKQRENSKPNNDQVDQLENENVRLRKRMTQLEHQNVEYLRSDEGDKNEYKNLVQLAKNKIQSLEYQMELNAKKWGKEKSDLLIQLQEAENRFKSAIHVQETDKEFLRNLPYKRYDAKY